MTVTDQMQRTDHNTNHQPARDVMCSGSSKAKKKKKKKAGGIHLYLTVDKVGMKS